MTVFQKWLGCWLGSFACAGVSTLLMMRVSDLFIIAFFLNLPVWSYFMRQIVCEQCGTPVSQTVDDYHDRPRMFRVPVSIFKRRCHVCGCDLTKHTP